MPEARCLQCSALRTQPGGPRCERCGGRLIFEYAEDDFQPVAYDQSMWRYRTMLPIDPQTVPISLGEGGTPLHSGRGSFPCRVFWKDETRNPTGSQKDRAIAVAMTKAVELGHRAVFLVSAGSTGVAAAAFAARAGLRCVVIVGQDTPPERLTPILVLGAQVMRYEGSVDDALDLLDTIGERGDLYQATTARAMNPYQADGPKTIAYEIWEQLGTAPDWVLVPVGGGGTLAGIHRGFVELCDRGLVATVPRMAGIQPTGYDSLVRAVARGEGGSDADLRRHRIQAPPPTIQVKIAHVYSPDGEEALSAVRSSGGVMLASSDQQSLSGVADLARTEGILAEPSSGTVVHALRRLVEDGMITEEQQVVCVVTGGGFRELPDLATGIKSEVGELPAKNAEAILSSIASS
jgi:threonine synthase